jgi:hypothetical protein
MANLSNINNKFLVTTGGNVGINSTSPGEKLEVNGNIQSLDTIYIKNASNGVKWQFYRDGNETLNFRYNNGTDWNSNAISIKNNNNVGIGTYSPSAKLDVRKGGTTDAQGDTDLLVQDSSAGSSTAQVQILGGATGFSNLYFSDTAAYNVGGFIYNHSNNYLATNVNGSERMRITSAGNVGINCTPSYKLQWSDGTRTGLLDTNTGAVVVGSVTNDALAFYTNLTEKMRISSTGDVGIGTTPTVGYNLDVKRTSAGYSIVGRHATGGKIGIYSSTGDNGIGTINNYPMNFFTNNSGPQVTLTTAGFVGS